MGFLRAPDPEAEFELRGDPVVVRSILDAARHIALVDMAGATNVPVPYGVGQPQIDRQYLMESTPRGDRWIKSAGIPWCKTWTTSDDFNEDDATFEDDMMAPARLDRLELPAFSPFGTGADGPAVHDLDDGDADLGSVSICGRSFPDAEWRFATSWSPGGQVLPDSPFEGLAVGDEVLLYCAQAQAGGNSEDVGNVGRWEVHRVSGIDDDAGGMITWADYPGILPTFSLGQLIVYIQRVPNYTTIAQSGSLNTSAITCGSHAAGTGTGVVFVRASVQSTARYTSIAKGFAGGAHGENCELMGNCEWWQESFPGHGLRVPSGSAAPHYDGGQGKHGGGGAGGAGSCQVPLAGVTSCPDCTAGFPTHDCQHLLAFEHHARHPSPGGGGGHAAAGEGGDDNGLTNHSEGGGMHYAGRPGGVGGIAIGQSALMNPAAFYGNAVFGGGGGSAGDYFLVSNNPGGPGGDGGGFVAVFAKSLQNNGGGGFTIPTIDVNGSDGGFLSGGGAAGSILAYAETMGSALGLDPWFAAEGVTIVGANTGWSGIGGTQVGNAELATGAPGRGAVGRVQVHYELANNGYTANGSVNQTSGDLTYAGCWASAIYASDELTNDDDVPMEAGLLLEPTTLTATWTTDSDNLKPTFFLIGGNEPDLSDGVTYPVDPPNVWQDGTAFDIDNGVELDLSPYVLTPALYWQVWACLDTGTETGDTPTVLDISLCGVAQ